MKKYFIVSILLLIKVSVCSAQTTSALNALADKNNSVSAAPEELIFEKLKLVPNQTHVFIAILKDGKVSYYGVLREQDTLRYHDNYNKEFKKVDALSFALLKSLQHE